MLGVIWRRRLENHTSPRCPPTHPPTSAHCHIAGIQSYRLFAVPRTGPALQVTAPGVAVAGGKVRSDGGSGGAAPTWQRMPRLPSPTGASSATTWYPIHSHTEVRPSTCVQMRFNLTQTPQRYMQYTIRAQALNSLGWGPLSPAYLYRTPNVPDKPTIKAASLDPNSKAIQVTLTAPYNNGGSSVLGYRVVGTPTTGGAILNATGNAQKVGSGRGSGVWCHGQVPEPAALGCPGVSASAGLHTGSATAGDTHTIGAHRPAPLPACSWCTPGLPVATCRARPTSSRPMRATPLANLSRAILSLSAPPMCRAHPRSRVFTTTPPERSFSPCHPPPTAAHPSQTTRWWACLMAAAPT